MPERGLHLFFHLPGEQDTAQTKTERVLQTQREERGHPVFSLPRTKALLKKRNFTMLDELKASG